MTGGIYIKKIIRILIMLSILVGVYFGFGLLDSVFVSIMHSHFDKNELEQVGSWLSQYIDVYGNFPKKESELIEKNWLVKKDKFFYVPTSQYIRK